MKIDLKKVEIEKKAYALLDKKTESNIKKLSNDLYKMKWASKIFQILKTYHEKKHLKKRYDHMIKNTYLFKRKIFLIFNSWRNITNSVNKIKIKAKYSEYYNSRYNDIKASSNAEISRLQAILEKLEFDIQSEITQRHSLTMLYDNSINKGVDVFIKETNNIMEFDVSSINFLFLFNIIFAIKEFNLC